MESIITKISSRILIAAGLTDLIRWINPRPVILMYHGVSKTRCVNNQKHLSYILFKEQLQKLKNHYEFTTVENLTDLLKSDAIDKPLLAITFDDGYKNNYDVAAEILDELGLPATFFISTGYIGTNKWMWTDLLEYSIMTSKHKLIKMQDIGLEFPIDTLDNKNSAIVSIKSHLKTSDFYQTQILVENIAKTLLESAYKDPFDDYQFMTWDNVNELARSPFTIGAHTVNHPILTRVSQSIAEKEILSSRADIIDHIGKCSKVFCYPNGKKTDYNKAIMEFTKLHFESALSTVYGFARADEIGELRRVGVSNSLSSKKLFRRVANLTYGSG